MVLSDRLREAFRDYPYLGSDSGEPWTEICRCVDRLAALVPVSVGPFLPADGSAPQTIQVQIAGDGVREVDTGERLAPPGDTPRGAPLRLKLHEAGFYYDRQMGVWGIEGVNTHDLARRLTKAVECICREFAI